MSLLFFVGLYFFITLFLSAFIWAALVLAKKDDINNGRDLIEDPCSNKIENI